MRYISKKRWQYCLSLLLCTCLLLQIPVYSVLGNDRSADIIGSSPLLVSNFLTPAGLSGRGQIVGIADSGLDKGSTTDIHPDLQSESGIMPKIVMLKSYTDRETADDPNGHGTFMAATITGSGKASQGKYQGIAPGASLYFQALLDKNNNLQVPDNINDLFIPAYSAGVRIHVDGWGGGSNTYDDRTAAIDKFIYWYPDFLPVFGAGNSGSAQDSLTNEANSKNALVVGSSQVPRPAFDPESRFADQTAASSSVGPAGDGRIKPDLVAPGSALISAKSSLIEGNFAANSLYTRMGGTSMAAAVTGGALALLREQLNVQFNLESPSSALLKALLINGARSGSGDMSEQGFGILDSSGTALALEEGTFTFIDQKSPLAEGASQEYKFEVTDPNLPVKITLTWVDPPGEAGTGSSLVNNLDLVVQDPSGQTLYGNDFTGKGIIDTKNNVEQVSVLVPKAGEYTIKVKASQLGREGGQDFALVYGQTLKTGVVTGINNNTIFLDDGTSFNLGDHKLHQVVDGKLTNSVRQMQVGSEVYLSSDSAYVFGETWNTGGIQALPTTEGDLLLEMNTAVREGGYYLDPRADEASGNITVNHTPVNNILDIPTGAELKGSINPFLQTLWKLEASNQEVNGFIAAVNSLDRELVLLQSNQPYRLAPWAAFSYRDQIIDSSSKDLPYGTAEQSTLDKLLPGSKVTMQISPSSGLVQSILIERPLITGQAVNVDVEKQQLTLDTGNIYTIFPGSAIYANQKQANLADVQPGDWIKGQLLQNSQTIIQLQAFSRVSYGRVVYVSAKQKNLYTIESNNQTHKYTFTKDTEIYGSGISLETAAIKSGSWVRIVSDSSGKTAWRVDLAEVREEKVKTIESINIVNRTLKMTDGLEYSYNNATRFTIGGYEIDPQDIRAGATALVTILGSPSADQQPLAEIAVMVPANSEPPDLQVTARSLNGVLIIMGSTTADQLYLYRQDGSREHLTLTDGQISRLFKYLDDERELRVVAIDTDTGAIKASDIDIVPFIIDSQPVSFSDTMGHWAEKYINDLASRKIIEGCGDGTYRPDKVLTRAELAVIIARMQNLDPTDIDQNIKDYVDIPWWALEAVLANREEGYMIGYDDGSFRPNWVVTRLEMEIIVTRLNGGKHVDMYPDGTGDPLRAVTRGEAAAILDQI